ncbi:peptidase S41-like protein [Christiangramia gaetbulicola]|uniref:Peptidase S41-like protein n=1 Tax=Christiangramia gaetbulicola TaxID=703340 RepID=A0A2T6AI47_9FLAO|nr:S41 family peptidase [Christiangramia gaetbulicola]PTX43471.1 peptidase S41-like protein [Christiangramia gaetbulicola]
MKSRQLYVILLTLFSFYNNYSQTQIFSRNEVREDLEILKDLLEKSHYNLYAYTSKEEFDSNFEEIARSLKKDSITLKEAVGTFQKVISKANVGHAEIDFPAISYIAFAQQGGKIFPLEIALEDSKAYIRKNYSNNPELKIGSEILEVNGKKIEDILELIYPHISAERPYLKKAKIEFWSFPRLYWQIFGEQAEFSITAKEQNQIKEYDIQSVSAIEDYEYKRKDILSSDREFKFYGKNAYLNPGNFSGDEMDYRKFIDSAFSVINEKAPENLIVDLRNNAGGDNSFSDYLISYFADKPFQWNSKFSLKTSEYLKENTRSGNDTTNAYSQKILGHQNGEVFPYHFEETQPQESGKRFKGNVFTLINRQTYSQAAVAASVIQDYQFGTIAGEESGDYPSLYASIFTVELPNTKIPVKIPKGYMVRVNKSEKQEGVIPEIPIKDHLLDERDEILDTLLNKIGY